MRPQRFSCGIGHGRIVGVEVSKCASMRPQRFSCGIHTQAVYQFVVSRLQ